MPEARNNSKLGGDEKLQQTVIDFETDANSCDRARDIIDTVQNRQCRTHSADHCFEERQC
jgi:hypothetical protein